METQKGGERRAGYALRVTDDFVVAMSGSFDVLLKDGAGEKTIHLNRSYEGLYIPRGVWREFRNFSTTINPELATYSLFPQLSM